MEIVGNHCRPIHFIENEQHYHMMRRTVTQRRNTLEYKDPNIARKELLSSTVQQTDNRATPSSTHGHKYKNKEGPQG